MTVSYRLPSSPEDNDINPQGAETRGAGYPQEDGSQNPNQPPPPGAVTHNFEVAVKYVRREIRDLTDRDRETFFNAVAVLQRVPSAVGREIYGDKYYSKDYFNRLHLHYGMLNICYFRSHMVMSLVFYRAGAGGKAW